MKTQLIGYLETKEHKDAYTDEWQDHDEGHTTWSLYFQRDNNFFKVDVCSEYGSCGSGYCGASWGSICKLLNVSSIPSNIVKTKEEVYIELLPNDILNVIFKVPKYGWDATEEELLSTDGVQIAYSTGDGGCGYYPSGSASINLNLFEI